MTEQSPQHLPTPALKAALQRRFDDATIQRLLSLYTWTVRHGGLEECSPLRTPGSSFNPRPARYALIALNHLEAVSEAEVATLFLRAVPHPLTAPPEFSQEAQVSHRLASVTPIQLGHAELPLEGCVALDTVRHLHLSASPQAQAILDSAQQLCALAAGQDRAATICRLLNHAISQQATLLAAKEAS